MKDAGGYTGTLADPISWLLGADMLRRAWEVNDDRVPPNPRGGIYFKLYFPDVGLLTCKAGLDYDTIVSKDGRTSCIRGSIAENFVLNELDYALDRGGDAYYWENASGRAEVDFQVVLGGEAVPVEVKSGTQGGMKSLWSLMHEKNLYEAVRCSLENFGTFDYTDKEAGGAVRHITTCPLYAVSMMTRL